MTRHRFSRPRRALWTAILWLAVAAAAGASDSADADTVLTGRLVAIWGDSPIGSGGGARLVWSLASDAGENVMLDLDDELVASIGGPLAANGAHVQVLLEAGEPPHRVTALVRQRDTDPLSPNLAPASQLITGSQPWISLLCKFSNIAQQPHDLAFFQSMFANSPGRLDHYWREVSYNTANVAGSTAAGWVVLPHVQTYYVPTPGAGCLDGNPSNDANLQALFDDCAAAADPLVDFSAGGGFVGINLMFNSDLDGCAWGGGAFATLDGVSKVWRTTWEPPWGYANVSAMAHEMGHGFGLPHSNNWDDDGWPYDNSWDVMSDNWSYTAEDAVYGTLGQHTIAFHKDVLGWIPPSQKLVAPATGQVTFILDDLALASTPNYRMAEIPVSSGFDSWTVEVRARTGSYDGQLPTKAVIIHQIDRSRSEAAWCYDSAVPPGNAADGEGSIWRVGETFEYPAEQVQVRVNAETAQGFRVTIRHVDPNGLFSDGFESGSASQWSIAP